MREYALCVWGGFVRVVFGEIFEKTVCGDEEREEKERATRVRRLRSFFLSHHAENPLKTTTKNTIPLKTFTLASARGCE